MRGRTNVGGGGLAINAVAVDKTVKSGNIIAGDFVEYYTEDVVIEQSKYNQFIGTIGDYIVSFRYTNARHHYNSGQVAIFKNGEQKSAYAYYNMYDACVYNNFIIFVANQTLGVLRINNDTLELVTALTESTINTSTRRDLYVCAGGGKVCVFGSYSSKSYFNVCDIASDGTLSNMAYSNISSDGEYYNQIAYADGYFYFTGSSSSSTSISTLRLSRAEIDLTNNVTARTYLADISIAFSSDDLLFQNGDMIVKSIRWDNRTTIAIIYLTNGSYSEIRIGSGYYYISNIYNEYFVAGKYTSATTSTQGYITLYLYHFLEQNNDIDLINTIVFSEEAALPAFTKDNILYAANDYDLHLFRIVGNTTIEKIPDTDYVIPYQGNGNPIGVAKEPGTTDSVIAVYIPVPVE